jgi:hypothetical protein
LRHKTVVVEAGAEPEQTQVVVRQSLRDQLSASFLPTLFSRVDLQEPTFKEIVVIYRTKEQSEEGVRAGAAPYEKKERASDSPSASAIVCLPRNAVMRRRFTSTYLPLPMNTPADGRATQAHLGQIISRHSTCGL